MLNKLKKYFLLAPLLLPFAAVRAQTILNPDVIRDMEENSTRFADEGGFDTGTYLGSFIEILIKGFLSILGIIFLILIIVAGFNWMTAAGDESKVTKAKDTIQRAIIGLVIIAASYVITYFVFNNLPGGNGNNGPV